MHKPYKSAAPIIIITVMINKQIATKTFHRCPIICREKISDASIYRSLLNTYQSLIHQIPIRVPIRFEAQKFGTDGTSGHIEKWKLQNLKNPMKIQWKSDFFASQLTRNFTNTKQRRNVRIATKICFLDFSWSGGFFDFHVKFR